MDDDTWDMCTKEEAVVTEYETSLTEHTDIEIAVADEAIDEMMEDPIRAHRTGFHRSRRSSSEKFSRKPCQQTRSRCQESQQRTSQT